MRYQTHREPRRSLSMIGFGYPSDPRTMSGYAASLADALRADDLLAAEYSLRDLRPADVLRGSLRLRRQGRRIRPEVRRGWLWSDGGVELLSQRLTQRIEAAGDEGPFLQIGTLGRLDSVGARHFMWTDMTIAQARRAGRFAVGEMSSRQLDTAERGQVETLAGAEAVFVNCGWARHSVIEDCGVEPSRVHVVFAGGNLGFPVLPAGPRRSSSILFVGRDWDRKGGPLLADAFTRVHRELPHARLDVVGCRPDEVVPGMNVVGPLDPRNAAEATRLRELFLEAACLCHPASFDPFPNVLVEAAWAGLPVVTLDTGSRSEAVVHGETGYLVSSPDPGKLADRMTQLLSDADAAFEMGRKARARAEVHFSWDGIVQQIDEVVNG